VFHGAGSAGPGNYDEDAVILTSHLPSTWGIVDFVPSGAGGLWYSNTDFSSDGAELASLSQQFTTGNLHAIGMSDGVRALRRMQNDGHFGQRTGLMLELDPYSIYAMPSPNQTIDYAAYATYYGDYIIDGVRVDGSGPAFTSSDGLSFDFVAVRRGSTTSNFDVIDIHSEILGNDRQRIREILTGHALGGPQEAIKRLNADRKSEVAPPLTEDGSLIITSPPTSGGGGGSSPVGGGGVGVESRPDWRRRRSGGTP
jgi:hypothetical protein